MPHLPFRWSPPTETTAPPMAIESKYGAFQKHICRTYRIPTVSDVVTMSDTKDEPLTSFAENPTKSVEKDALVESQPQFPRPEHAEKTNVEEAKWPWTKGKQNEKMSRFFITIILSVCLGIVVLTILGCFIWALSSVATKTVQEPEIVYTLPTIDIEKENQKAAQARVILPEVLKNAYHSAEEESTTTPESVIEEITENFVQEVSVSADEHEREYEKEDVTEEGYLTVEQTSTTQQPVQKEEATTTTKKLFSSTSLHFHDSIDGEESEGCFGRHLLGSPSGVYKTFAPLNFSAYCDMETEGGGWTVIQRRIDSEGNFHRATMKDYIEGFGNQKGSHWLGLEQIRYLAPRDAPPSILRIEIQGETCDLTCSKKFANTWVGEWKVSFGRKEDGYMLHVFGEGVGNLTFNGVDPFAANDKSRFSTVDNDEDESSMNCAQFRMVGPWWHSNDCSDVGLNGYLQTTSEKYNVKDRNQNGKRYFVWAFEKQTYNGYPYIIHVRKSLMLLKPDTASLDY